MTLPRPHFGPVLETARLRLRVPRPEDFDGYAELRADSDASRYIGGCQPRSAAWRGFLQMPGAWLIQGFGMFSVLDRGSGAWLGLAGPWRPEGWPGNEIGWSFRRAAWGHGYATEAARAAGDWALANLGWDDVIHCIDPRNVRSQAVAARLGSRRLRGARLPAPFDEVIVDVWGQARAEWLARRAPDTAGSTTK